MALLVFHDVIREDNIIYLPHADNFINKIEVGDSFTLEGQYLGRTISSRGIITDLNIAKFRLDTIPYHVDGYNENLISGKTNLTLLIHTELKRI